MTRKLKLQLDLQEPNQKLKYIRKLLVVYLKSPIYSLKKLKKIYCSFVKILYFFIAVQLFRELLSWFCPQLRGLFQRLRKGFLRSCAGPPKVLFVFRGMPQNVRRFDLPEFL